MEWRLRETFPGVSQEPMAVGAGRARPLTERDEDTLSIAV